MKKHLLVYLALLTPLSYGEDINWDFVTQACDQWIVNNDSKSDAVHSVVVHAIGPKNSTLYLCSPYQFEVDSDGVRSDQGLQTILVKEPGSIMWKRWSPLLQPVIDSRLPEPS